MFLVIDNYDSFVHNLVRYFECAGQDCLVVRNDAITLEEIEAYAPEALILSPGPCAPQDAGICVEAVKQFGKTLPILGICLGHQAIGEAYGALTLRAQAPVHGKACEIRHDHSSLFQGLPSSMTVGRYHSLIVQPAQSSPLRVTAQTDTGEIMAFEHESAPVYGLQFHPESILTPEGGLLIENFIALVQAWHQRERLAA